MNKKLVALAVAGAVASPLAAQAQTANVTMYGRLNVSYEFVKGDIGGTNPTVHRLSSNSSRWGVKGEENLGRGLKAIFQIESNISGDGRDNCTLNAANRCAGSFFSRDTFVGLNGNFGTVRFGRFLMPLDDLHPIFGNGPTYLTSVLSTAALWANGTIGRGAVNEGSGFATGFDDRVANSVRWDSPSFGGFTTSIQYATQENARKGWTAGINGIYKAGPFQIGVGYEHDDEIRGPGTKDHDLSIAGSWNFGIGTVAAAWDRIEYDGNSTGGGVLQIADDLKRDFWGISGTFNLGPGKLFAFYGQTNDWKGTGNLGTGAALTATRFFNGSDTGARQYEISYTYDLSKRTSVYGGYVRIQNENRANYTFNINPYAVVPGGDPQAFIVGMLHLF